MSTKLANKTTVELLPVVTTGYYCRKLASTTVGGKLNEGGETDSFKLQVVQQLSCWLHYLRLYLPNDAHWSANRLFIFQRKN